MSNNKMLDDILASISEADREGNELKKKTARLELDLFIKDLVLRSQAEATKLCADVAKKIGKQVVVWYDDDVADVSDEERLALIRKHATNLPSSQSLPTLFPFHDSPLLPYLLQSTSANAVTASCPCSRCQTLIPAEFEKEPLDRRLCHKCWEVVYHSAHEEK